MMASELIDKIQKIIDVEGDQEIFISTACYNEIINSVDLENTILVINS